MNPLSLIGASIRHYLRDWIFLILGAALSTMVVTGALLVGDTLRGSLARVGLEKLGWVKQAMFLPRLVPQDLATRLLPNDPSHAKGQSAVGILIARGSVSISAKDTGAVRGIQVYGVDESFWGGFDSNADRKQGVWMNPTLARLLGSNQPQTLQLSLARPSDTPRESLLGRKDVASGLATFEVTCQGTLPPSGPGSFCLAGGISAEPVLFVPIADLQKALDCPGRINALLSPAVGDALVVEKSRLTLEDYGLFVRGPSERVETLFARHDRDNNKILVRREWQGHLGEALARELAKGSSVNGGITKEALLNWYRQHRNHITLESKQFYLPDRFAEAAHDAAREVKLVGKSVLVHLANRITLGDKELAYSVVVGISDPLGFGADQLLVPPAGQASLLDFPNSPLLGIKSSEIVLDYFPAEHTGEPRESKTKLPLAGRLEPRGMAVDFDLAPEFPGITDKLSLAEWNPPFPYDNKRIKPIDDTFWKEFRASPKVVLDLKTAQDLFGSRFGKFTSVIAEAQGVSADDALKPFQETLLQKIDPAGAGMSWIPLAKQATERSAGNMDFSGLFLGFSFFLLASAIGLFSLLLRLHLERRMGEWGLCAALGWTKRRIFGRILAEAIGPGVAGILLGTPLAVWYCGFLANWLESNWPGGGLDGRLAVAASVKTLAMGGLITLFTLLLSVYWRSRSILGLEVSVLLAGERADDAQAPGAVSSGVVNRGKPGPLFWGLFFGSILGVVALSLLGPQLGDAEARAGSFFGAGALGLIGLLMLFRRLLGHWDSRTILDSRDSFALGLRGATRKPGRSLLSAGLLASSVFLLFAVDAFHRSAQSGDEGDKASWSGGFRLWVELDTPLYQDMNTPSGKADLLDNIERAAKSDPASARKNAAEILNRSELVTLRLREGDDISCLNLMQSSRPRLLGVSQGMIDRGGFRFAASAKGFEANPWKALEGNGNPVLGEKNTLMWTLHKGMGDSVSLGEPNTGGFDVTISGILSDSVFQSELLMSQKRLLQLDPSVQGFRVVLAGCAPEDEAELGRILATGLAPLGPVIRTSHDRLESFLAVENTYLATFQALGWLGLLLGMVGLAIAQARSVLERAPEWALLSALGFSRKRIGILVMTESAVLVLAGLLTGLLAALIAVWPQLAGAGLAWSRILLLSGLVAGCGMASSLVSALVVARLGLLGQLRRQG